MVGDSLRRLLQAMFDRLDDALYETADKAESHNVQFRYLDAMRDMRKQRASIEAVSSATLWTATTSSGAPGRWSAGRARPAPASRASCRWLARTSWRRPWRSTPWCRRARAASSASSTL